MVVSTIKLIIVEQFEFRRRSDGSSYIIGMVLEGTDESSVSNATGRGNASCSSDSGVDATTATASSKGNPLCLVMSTIVKTS